MSLPDAVDIQHTWRYELKYKLTYQQYRQVRTALAPYTAFDSYTKAKPSNKYVVRSLYFDTPDYQAYDEKLNGNHSRYKFRIRTYSDALANDTVIHVEAKLRQGAKSEKLGTFVSIDAYCEFMERYHWPAVENPILIEFERSVHSRILRPKVLIEYHREGYQCRGREDIRITFDHHVHSAQAKSLFPRQAFFRQHNSHEIVLEIKHRDQQPEWLKGVVQAHGLKVEPNSKYCQGIEITQLDFVNHALRL